MPIGIKGKSSEANYVVIGCNGFSISLVHFKSNSVLVKVGDQITVGQKVGLIGDSGFTDGPHLHIMAFRVNLSNERTPVPLPITFNGKYYYRGDNFTN